ncbi:MAG: DUF1207 domain-containing protein [Pirellulales bacterium]|nr:DUF1207 domain-containing protein [Pirellulales bacterium]
MATLFGLLAPFSWCESGQLRAHGPAPFALLESEIRDSQPALNPLDDASISYPYDGVTREYLSAPAAPPSILDGGAPDLASTEDPWSVQALPSGLIYRSYLAGQKESRFASTWVNERDWGWIWDIAIGGRVGLVRYGSEAPDFPEGVQVDLEGAAFPRLDLEHKEDVIATDFRFGMPISFGNRRFQTKLAVYHLSSHLGDEYMIRWETLDRINYSRNVLVWGNSFYWTDELRLYAEAGWAFYAVGGSEPWEFQFGAEYAPSAPTGLRPAPFLAVNTHLREEVDFGGNLVLQTGWAWRGVAGQLFRAGMQYYTGKSDQYEFYDQFEDKIGFGLWYDY